MLYRGLKSLDELNALKEQEKLIVNQPLISEASSPAFIDYSNHPLDPSLVSALIAFDPANPYQSGINLFSVLDSNRNLRGVLDS